MESISELFGNRVREYRSLRGLSQEQLALRANINVSFLGQIERGGKKPTIDTIDKLLTALDVKYAEFFDFDSDAGSQKSTDLIDKITYELQMRTSGEQQLVYDIMRRIFIYNDFTVQSK